MIYAPSKSDLFDASDGVITSNKLFGLFMLSETFVVAES